ncbi:hypothetical protein NQ176_g10224 [Zarea fungicola]|uniref:Uncharacterized protein n=1 Tax=Zarea fungicola TaxID=93591 RepID=A0ACC1MIB3_9HYPO|nr:hypothetical protein NQ176_g10224 [Lecanicillium fungicola]
MEPPKKLVKALLAAAAIVGALGSRSNPTCITNGFSYVGESGHTDRVFNKYSNLGATLFGRPDVSGIATSFSNQYLNVMNGHSDEIPLATSSNSIDAYFFSCCDTWILEATSIGNVKWHLSNMQPGMTDAMLLDAVKCFDDNRRINELTWDIDDVNGDLEVRFKIVRSPEIN